MRILDGQSERVSSGQTLSGFEVSAHVTLGVQSGGEVVDTTVDQYGTLFVFGYGESLSAVVSMGGREVCRAPSPVQGSTPGFVGVGDVILSGGELQIASGGQVSGETVSSGGLVTFANAVISSGVDIVYDQTSASATTSLDGVSVLSGGRIYLSSILVESGGVLSISEASRDSISAVVDAGAVLEGHTLIEARVYGLISGVEIGDGVLYSGAEASGVSVLSFVQISSGAVSYDERILSGGDQIMLGEAFSTTIDSGGRDEVFGVASGVLVNNGADLEVEVSASLAFADDVTIHDGGMESVYVDATTSGVIVDGGARLFINSGGAAHNITINKGGLVEIYSGNRSVTGITVSSGGQLQVINDAVVSGVRLASGGEEFHDYIIDYTGSNEIISSGAFLSNIGTVTDATVLQGGVAYNLGRMSHTLIDAGGEEIVISSATDVGATLSGVPGQAPPRSDRIGADVGLQVVGGSASATTIGLGGVQEVEADPVAGIFGSATQDTILSGGMVEVNSGATLSGAIVDSGGEVAIYQGATLGSLKLVRGATLDLANQTATSARISAGELVVLSSGARLEAITLSGATAGLTVIVGADGEGGTSLYIRSTSNAEAASTLTAAAAAFISKPGVVGAYQARSRDGSRMELALTAARPSFGRSRL